MEIRDALKYINNAPKKIAKAVNSAPTMIAKGAQKAVNLPRDTFEKADRGVQQIADQAAKHKMMAIKNGSFAKSAQTKPQRDAIGPEAQTGRISQRTAKSATYADEQTAKQTFRRQSESLLRPGGWNDNTAGLTYADAPTWHLLDANGKEETKNRRIEKGDILRIDAPGPDFFVQADRIHVGKDNIQFTVRPCADPANRNGATTAHFFTDGSTRTFEIQNDGREVRFVTTGNNESPNVGGQSGGLKNAAWNTASSAAIVGGGGDLYWGAFGKGLMNK